jgi:hypothetical protein
MRAAVGLTTRPPGALPGPGLPERPVPALPELAALLEELRALVIARGAAGARPLPPLPETGAATDLALGRWLRAALGSASLAPETLKGLVEEAFQRLAADGAAAPEPRALEAAREMALRLVASADVPERAAAAPAGPVDRGLALRILAEEIRRAVGESTGAEPPFVAAPAAAEDPGNAGAALLGWLRTAAARVGVPLEALAPAVEIGRAHV